MTTSLPPHLAPVPAGWRSAVGQPSGDGHPAWTGGHRGNQQGDLQGQKGGGDCRTMDWETNGQIGGGATLDGIT